MPGNSVEPDADWPGVSLIEFSVPISTHRRKEARHAKFLIEPDIPGAGKLSAAQLKEISQKSCGVLQELGPQIQWLQSYVTGDKVYCVYIAPDEAMVREQLGKVVSGESSSEIRLR